ncbi:MAG TPA: hypothetical protein DEB15_16085 [Pusillimonas sp.]|nr:hypothetical protein [Pusillimonas sp.]MBC41754.1 hypothetical protein [Pusillimonas sp.]HBT34230.1 hypothetical protein [Pusillimonas sp.]|tara:strand:- start:209046 stop:211514 length:2469 start_codon:yes stop_codon:yes gene_type:complete
MPNKMPMHETLPGLKIIKPGRTELVHRIYSPEPDQYAMSFGVMVPFVLQASGTEQDITFSSIWEHAANVLQKNETLDEGWPKPKGEFLAAGCCYSPAGTTQQPVSAHISIGALNKRLAVFGPRKLNVAGGISAPDAFEKMPITLTNAFGGKGYDANPNGKGFTNKGGDAELPNIELPDHLMLSAKDRPPVAGFGPLPSAYPQRAQHLGKQNEHWRNTRWPHLPVDTDARYFMAAAQDQHLDSFWAGGETIEIQNMHPEHPVLQGRLPRTRPRFFVHQSSPDGSAHFRELNVHLDTVWLLPEERLGVLTFRGSIAVSDPDARDINAFYAEFEDPGELPLPVDLYLNNCLKGMAPEVFKDVPDVTSPDFKASLESTSGEELIKKVRDQREYFQASLNKAGIREDQLLGMLEANPNTRQFAQAITQRSKSLTGFFNEIEGLLKVIQEEEGTQPPAETKPADTQAALKKALTPYPQPAPFAPQAAPASNDTAQLHDAMAAARNRQLVVNAQANGYPCVNLDLTHANLAGLDLSGMDFSGSVLAGANLAGAKLQGACLNGIFATGTRFDAADLSGCQFVKASLGKSSFVGSTLRGANLESSDCTEANFSSADLSSANLQKATLSHAWLQGIRAERLVASGAQFDQANMDNAQLPAARLDGANLAGASVKRINLQGAIAPKANLSQANLAGANLTQADLSGSQAGPGTSFQNALLDRAILETAAWAGANLNEVSMLGVKASKMDLSDCILTRARLTKSDLRSACFDRSDLEQAEISAANLMQASFIHANLQSVNFDNSNLYNATFVDTKIAGARFHNANLDNTLLATQ